MRVIRTEMYFDEVATEYKLTPDVHSVSFAWFKVEREFPVDDLIIPHVNNAHNLVARFLDIAVQGMEQRGFQRRIGDFHVRNRHIVDALLEAPVVIEQSPPEVLPFSRIISKGSSITIGTLVGYSAATQDMPLLFITVPLGILVVGSAVGVSKALEKGLHKRIELLLTKRKRPRK